RFNRRPPRVFHAELNGAQEVPAISTMSTATFSAQLNAAEDMLTYELRYSALEGGPGPTAAHVHIGQPGVAGGVMFFLCGGGPAPGTKPACPAAPATVTGTVVASDVVAVTAQGIAAGEFDEVIRAMRTGITYANIHDATWPGGEIRGVVIPVH